MVDSNISNKKRGPLDGSGPESGIGNPKAKKTKSVASGNLAVPININPQKPQTTPQQVYYIQQVSHPLLLNSFRANYFANTAYTNAITPARAFANHPMGHSCCPKQLQQQFVLARLSLLQQEIQKLQHQVTHMAAAEAKQEIQKLQQRQQQIAHMAAAKATSFTMETSGSGWLPKAPWLNIPNQALPTKKWVDSVPKEEAQKKKSPRGEEAPTSKPEPEKMTSKKPSEATPCYTLLTEGAAKKDVVSKEEGKKRSPPGVTASPCSFVSSMNESKKASCKKPSKATACVPLSTSASGEEARKRSITDDKPPRNGSSSSKPSATSAGNFKKYSNTRLGRSMEECKIIRKKILANASKPKKRESFYFNGKKVYFFQRFTAPKEAHHNFDIEMCICFDNVPVIPSDHPNFKGILNKTAVNCFPEAKDILIDYITVRELESLRDVVRGVRDKIRSRISVDGRHLTFDRIIERLKVFKKQAIEKRNAAHSSEAQHPNARLGATDQRLDKDGTTIQVGQGRDDSRRASDSSSSLSPKPESEKLVVSKSISKAPHSVPLSVGIGEKDVATTEDKKETPSSVVKFSSCSLISKAGSDKAVPLQEEEAKRNLSKTKSGKIVASKKLPPSPTNCMSETEAKKLASKPHAASASSSYSSPTESEEISSKEAPRLVVNFTSKTESDKNIGSKEAPPRVAIGSSSYSFEKELEKKIGSKKSPHGGATSAPSPSSYEESEKVGSSLRLSLSCEKNSTVASSSYSPFFRQPMGMGASTERSSPVSLDNNLQVGDGYDSDWSNGSLVF